MGKTARKSTQPQIATSEDIDLRSLRKEFALAHEATMTHIRNQDFAALERSLQIERDLMVKLSEIVSETILKYRR
jgi:hypothetical protein